MAGEDRPGNRGTWIMPTSDDSPGVADTLTAPDTSCDVVDRG
ncbi:hypothetical protein [Streptomyces naphthomycinicus]|nr:hypothetical protein [Streptomyces sp. TML10]